MESKQFQKLVEQLSDLSEVQRAALLEAVRGGKPANEAIALIEQRFAAAPACGHCGSASFGKWGEASGFKRYKCKAESCGRTFNALTGTPLAQLHRRDAWMDYARALVDGVSLRKAAKRTKVCLDTSFRWRHRFLKAAKNVQPAKVEGIVEADETFFLTSAKGSRKLTGRAPRKRGGRAKKAGLSEEHIPVLIVRDRHGATLDAKLPDLQGDTIKSFLRPPYLVFYFWQFSAAPVSGWSMVRCRTSLTGPSSVDLINFCWARSHIISRAQIFWSNTQKSSALRHWLDLQFSGTYSMAGAGSIFWVAATLRAHRGGSSSRQ